MSERGIPKSFSHMHLFGSHAFSMINAANERVWDLVARITRATQSSLILSFLT
jgi:catalase